MNREITAEFLSKAILDLWFTYDIYLHKNGKEYILARVKNKFYYINSDSSLTELDFNKYKLIIIPEYDLPSGNIIELYTEQDLAEDEQYMKCDYISFMKAVPIKDVIKLS